MAMEMHVLYQQKSDFSARSMHWVVTVGGTARLAWAVMLGAAGMLVAARQGLQGGEPEALGSAVARGLVSGEYARQQRVESVRLRAGARAADRAGRLGCAGS